MYVPFLSSAHKHRISTWVRRRLGILEHPIFRRRRAVSLRFLRGEGIEIGALNAPLPVGPLARVRYLDRCTVPDLEIQYPELLGTVFAPVDIVDHGEELNTLAAGSLDFIIANHMLEHCENPLGTMRAHFSRLKPGGILYYAVPDRRFYFDRGRPLTTFEHLLEDDRDGGQGARRGHYEEWVWLVEHAEDEGSMRSRVDALMSMSYSIHFHVWDETTFRAFLERARPLVGADFEVKLFERNKTELLSVLEKR